MNNEKVNYSSSDIAKFVLFAAFGIFMFFIPISIGGKSSIPIDHIVTLVKMIPNYGPIYAGAIVIIGAVLPFIRGTWNNSTTDIIFSFLKLLGIPFIIMAITNKGPEFLMAKDVIPFIYNSIVVTVTTVVPIGSVFLAFLVNFGLMEFVGVFMQPVMKPIWKTPGRSAIDAVASFVGSYSLALLITDKVYQDGKYTGKEAAIIATGFSTVSATFMIVVARTLDIMNHWLLYFWLTLVITFIVTAITARIYPLSKKPDTYYNDQEGFPEEEVTGNRFNIAVQEGMKAFKNAPTVFESVKENFINGINLALSIGPLLMSIGTLGIVVANHTPVFDIIGYIFYPFTMITQVPEPLLAAKAMALSIAEMFLPALLVTDADIITKFLIAIASVSEILFFSASIPCIMATKIPLKMSDYIIIWIERVILTILITTPILHLIF
ncbi:membrane protein [Peptoniphilus sp. ING2-D1G]|nr:membrane protein [Peptoniphilus sp. ING2-D1G]